VYKHASCLEMHKHLSRLGMQFKTFSLHKLYTLTSATFYSQLSAGPAHRYEATLSSALLSPWLCLYIRIGL